MKLFLRRPLVSGITGDDRHTPTLAASLRARDVDVRAVWPTRAGGDRAAAHLALTLNVDEQAISALLNGIAEELEARTA